MKECDLNQASPKNTCLIPLRAFCVPHTEWSMESGYSAPPLHTVQLWEEGPGLGLRAKLIPVSSAFEIKKRIKLFFSNELMDNRNQETLKIGALAYWVQLPGFLYSSDEKQQNIRQIN
jgi:hypothetical protein